MKPRSIALIVGAGVGAEVIPSALEVIEEAGVHFDFQRVDVPTVNSDTPEDYLAEAVAKIRQCRVGLKTKISGSTRNAPWHNTGNTATSPNVALRRQLDLYAGVRPICSQPGLPTRYPDLDLLLVRENTEDIYKGIEHEVVPGVVESLKVVTRSACDRIARFAFKIAEEKNRKKITFIHKANIMKRSDGLFRQTVAAVAEEFPNIAYEDKIVDAACMQLVLDPYRYDVILTGNLYGDILSSLGSGLVGGISNAHAINVGDNLRVFESIHGVAPSKENGTETNHKFSNPLPILSASLAMFRHFQEEAAAKRLGDAIGDTLKDGTTVTPDLGGSATTQQMCATIITNMQ